ncbi:VWA domain-containing protein [Aminobacter sp. J44]|uniref:vWA domain-containing protein n=1 Tax=Aminobacter sp. J44 TaxID=935262 RepID=UPI001199469D|nr:VWA domain-containing protein [Aminobacter sp. J44]TWG49972.1 Ca-activated chloride channel family protein [Aminobacter sp. J44]
MHDEFEILRQARPVKPSSEARKKALSAAMTAYDEADEKNVSATQGSDTVKRLLSKTSNGWRDIMRKWLWTGAASMAVASAAFFVVGGMYTQYMRDSGLAVVQEMASHPAGGAAFRNDGIVPIAPQPAPPARKAMESMVMAERGVAVAPAFVGNYPSPVMDRLPSSMQSRDRVREFKGSGVKSVAEHPVSTFSADVDTASYSMVRSLLNMGQLPNPDTVRVEELVNYFPYDWQLPETRDEPFRPTVTVMPSPWSQGRKLMHVAIKGYDVIPETRPQANLVFLIDVSGSMNAPDKLPLLKNAFRMLVASLSPDDKVSIVTYAGHAGVVLEPTSASDTAAIYAAIDGLTPSGGTAGEAGLNTAYRLASKAFIEGGVNRVMLATDGDFNVGQTSDEDLKRTIERHRESGVFLSVLGFGRGNYNDQLMQTIAQHGNGTAAYIDTLAEAQKVLVDEASSAVFPIAKDVKFQVEFNPSMVSEYRLIGYETRELAREDFNNDRVDAGDIGSGSSVTAIYEITPKGSPAALISDLRYGKPQGADVPGEAQGEYAFLKIRYKLPDEDESRLIDKAVTDDDEVEYFADAPQDVRFSVAVAGFGQKLRRDPSLAQHSWEEIKAMAASSRGNDSYGYRSSFLSLVGLAQSLDRAAVAPR